MRGRVSRRLAAALALSLACFSPLYAQESKGEGRRIAFTFDDLPQAGPAVPLSRVEEMTAKLLDGLKRNDIPVVAFVNEKKLFVEGETGARTALLRRWLEAGHELGNHTFSHPSFQTTPLPAFEEDVVRGETVMSLLLREQGRKVRYFRHPFLQTGPTPAARLALENFLAGRGYTVAPVSVDNSDWIFAAVYADAKTAGDAALMEKLRAAYLGYVAEMLGFFEKLSIDVLGRPMRHVLLVHANELNADTLDGVADLFRKRGYRFVTLGAALTDPAWGRKDAYAGPNGVSWLHRWLFSDTGRMRLKEEPEPPDFVMKLYRARG